MKNWLDRLAQRWLARRGFETLPSLGVPALLVKACIVERYDDRFIVYPNVGDTRTVRTAVLVHSTLMDKTTKEPAA